MNIRKWTGIVLAVMLLSTVFTAGAATFTPGDYEASAQGFGGTVSVKLTVDEEAITAIEITGEGETPALGGAAIEQMSAAYVGQADAEGVDGMTGATITRPGVRRRRRRRSPSRRAPMRALPPVTTATWC